MTIVVNQKMMIWSTIQKIYHLVGMESESLNRLKHPNSSISNPFRPIPYWLYNLHGLGIEFKCEICGNYSYWGRRAFERHFSEWRHSYGMKCLRIPNTVHFKDITSINDALVRKFDPKQHVLTTIQSTKSCFWRLKLVNLIQSWKKNLKIMRVM